MVMHVGVGNVKHTVDLTARKCSDNCKNNKQKLEYPTSKSKD